MRMSTVAAGAAAVMAFDALAFTRSQKRKVDARPTTLKAIEAYLDNAPGGGGCDAAEGCISSIDATCSKLACQASGCGGDYSSGECKDIKELHDLAGCEFAKEDCGRDLPEDFFPACRHWWSYRCRVARVFPGMFGDVVATD